MNNRPTLSETAQAPVTYIEENRCICPWGEHWHKLHKMLPDRRQLSGGGWEPPLPFILNGWYMSNNLEKALRLREHIEWADAHGVIDKVDRYLRGLPPEAWHHVGD